MFFNFFQCIAGVKETLFLWDLDDMFAGTLANACKCYISLGCKRTVVSALEVKAVLERDRKNMEKHGKTRNTSWLWVSTSAPDEQDSDVAASHSGHHSKTLGAEETKAPSKARFDELNELNLLIVKDSSKIVELTQLKDKKDINSIGNSSRLTLGRRGTC